MIKKEEIHSNINTEFCISSDCLKESRYGLCRYINDVCSSIEDMNNEISSIAMTYVNYFFVKKCYFQYDKLVIACASILLACKYQNVQGKFDQICRRYSEINMKIMGNFNAVIKPEDIQKIKDKICAAELTLMKVLNFSINIYLPNEFIYVYSALLYPDNEEDVVQFALKVAGDSFFTYSNLLFKNWVVAIASVLISANFLNLPSFLNKNFPNLINMKRFYTEDSHMTEETFNRSLLICENKSVYKDNSARLENDLDGDKEDKFNDIPVIKRIHPFLEIEELEECVKLILEYYSDIQNN